MLFCYLWSIFMNWLNATGWVYAINDSHCWPICYLAYLLRGLLPTYLNYLVYMIISTLITIISWNFTSFRLHNFCGLIQTLAFSFLTRAIVQFLLLSSTLGSVKGITQREVNYSILCVMRRSFLFEWHFSLDFCICTFIWLLHQIDRWLSPLSKVTKHWFLFIPVRILGKLLEPW